MQVAEPTPQEPTFLPEIAPPKETPLNIETTANFKSQPLAPVAQATFDHSPESYRAIQASKQPQPSVEVDTHQQHSLFQDLPRNSSNQQQRHTHSVFKQTSTSSVKKPPIRPAKPELRLPSAATSKNVRSQSGKQRKIRTL